MVQAALESETDLSLPPAGAEAAADVDAALAETAAAADSYAPQGNASLRTTVTIEAAGRWRLDGFVSNQKATVSVRGAWV